jgi:hypothetical protein
VRVSRRTEKRTVLAASLSARGYPKSLIPPAVIRTCGAIGTAGESVGITEGVQRGHSHETWGPKNEHYDVWTSAPPRLPVTQLHHFLHSLLEVISCQNRGLTCNCVEHLVHRRPPTRQHRRRRRRVDGRHCVGQQCGCKDVLWLTPPVDLSLGVCMIWACAPALFLSW